VDYLDDVTAGCMTGPRIGRMPSATIHLSTVCAYFDLQIRINTNAHVATI